MISAQSARTKYSHVPLVVRIPNLMVRTGHGGEHVLASNAEEAESGAVREFEVRRARARALWRRSRRDSLAAPSSVASARRACSARRYNEASDGATDLAHELRLQKGPSPEEVAEAALDAPPTESSCWVYSVPCRACTTLRPPPRCVAPMQARSYLPALYIWAAAGSGVGRGEQNPSSNAKSPARGVRRARRVCRTYDRPPTRHIGGR